MNELSVAILSVGSPQFEFAVKSVENQTHAVPYFVIRDVSPFAASFNQMLAICETPYVIQLDEDMELYPESAARMLDAFKQQETINEQLAQMVFRLEDPELGIILGVKIFAVAKARQVSMDAGRFPDRDFNQRLEAIGFSTEIDTAEPAGSHARNRTDFEWFLKHAVSASKLARPHATESTEYDPALTDIRRFMSMLNATKSTSVEESMLTLGGLFWGLFNEVRTDTDTYPSEVYEKLQKLVPHLAAEEKAQQLRELVDRSNDIISTIASSESEPDFYIKENYYGRNYRTALSHVLVSPMAAWDIIGLGFGEMAVALQELQRLRGIYIDARSHTRLKNPVTAKIDKQLDYSNPMDTPAQPAPSGGVLVPNGARMTLDELTSLMVENYECAVVDLVRLDKNNVDSKAFLQCMLSDHKWTCSPNENNVVCLNR